MEKAECVACPRASASPSWLCIALMASISLVTFVRDRELISAMPDWASTASSLVFGLEFAGLAIVGYFAVHLVRPRAFSAFAFACTVVGSVLWQGVVGSEDPSIALFLCASALFDCGRCWGIVMTALCLSRLDVSKRFVAHTFAGVGLSYMLFAAFSPVISAFPMGIAGVCVAAPICLGYVDNKKLFGQMLSTATPRDLDVANPFSFVPLSSTIYVCIFMFEIAFGYVAFLHTTSGSQETLFMGVVLLLAAGLCVVGPMRTHTREDGIFIFCTLAIVLGFLLETVPSLPDVAPAFFLSVGSQCFYCLVWAVLAIVGSRNPTGAFTAICLGFCASSTGAGVGFTVGAVSNGAAACGFPEANGLAIAALVFCLVAFVLVCMRGFRFDGFFQGIASVAVPVWSEEGPLSGDVRVHPAVGVALESESRGERAAGSERSEDDVRGGSMRDGGACEGDAPADGVLDDGPSDGNACNGSASGEGFSAPFDEFVLGKGLTPREKEIAFLLAKGRNGQFIQDRLVISRNTAKTHIRHIYQKLDVYSQQELIDLYESL